MTLVKRLLPAAFIIILAASAWLWWTRPRKADMAGYAPSDALVYLECNSLLDVGESIVNTNAWRDLAPSLGTAGRPLPSRWLRQVVSWTGIGSTQTVILSRAQVAAVMLDLGATEKGETLTIKPEAAILIETHTSERRIRPVVEEALRQFAQTAYEGPTLEKNDVAGAEFIVWSTPTRDHQIVATISGSLVIVGNNERAVKTCLDVQRGLRPSLRDDAEMKQMRQNLAASQALAFGFISSANAARLISTAAPLLLGRAPGGLRLDRMAAGGASRVLTGVGWSSRSSMGGIEDRYLFSLTPSLVSQLRPFFRATELKLGALALMPDNVHSVTVYKFEDPLATWQVLETSVSAQLDTLSAIVFSSLLKSGLTPYGIEDPRKFLRTVGPELITTRLARDSEKSLLIAQIRDEMALREILLGPSGPHRNLDARQDGELIEIPEKGIAVSFLKGNVLIGLPQDVRRCIETASERPSTPHNKRFERLEGFLRDSDSAGVATYASDGDRVMSFLRSIVRAKSGTAITPESGELIRKLEALPYSATETTLGEQGLERRTQSSFGQFGTLVPLLFPDR